MRENQYYDWSGCKLLSERNGCKFEDWPEKHADFPFALHPKDFPIFLYPDELIEVDEYSEGDPYTVEKEFQNEFHKRRVACTLHLIELSVRDKLGGLKLLDLGCGEGHITGKILEALPNAKICGLDYSLSAITYATSHFPTIDFCVADAYRPPYRKDYFDIVVCNNLWEHVPAPISLLSRINRIIKPRGHLIISTPSRYRLVNLVKVLLGKGVSLMTANHVTEYSVGQVIEQLRFGKFTVEKVYSKPIKEKPKTAKEFIICKTVSPILSAYLRMVKSHHNLEATVFFLARKNLTG